MNRPSPDDMKKIMMAEKRVKNKKLKENIECFINLFGFIGWLIFFEYMIFGYLPYCN